MERDNLVRPEEVVNEKSTAVVSITFKDEDGANAIPSTATYTLYDLASGGIINSVSGVSVPGTGAVRSITLDAEDNAMVDTNLATEEHRLYIIYTYGPGGAKTGSVEVQIIVVNMEKET